MVRAADIEPKEGPLCPECDEPMQYYGGSSGWVHCGYKILYRGTGWFGEDGKHVKDDRLAGGTRRVDGVVSYSNSGIV